jgi:glyoxylase-like metal-dependent hydrolase (beta-lactamase superfamily II)
MRFGDFDLTLVNGGDFRLDGGAMHGVVPKVLWNKLVSCDDKNRCSYATNCLLVDRVGGEGHGQRVLIETGNGDKFSAKEKDIYGIDHDRSTEHNLRALGVEPESIDYVVMTHLHFDHSGGAVRRTASGFAPVFARARHVVQARELADAQHPHERNRASYLDENIGPLVESKLLMAVDGETEFAPGIRVIPTPGHTAGHQSVVISDGNGHHVVFFGDVIPTALHLKLPFIMGYDLDVVSTLETKRRLLERVVSEKWLAVFGHERETPAGYLGLDAKGNAIVTEPVSLSKG